MPRPRKLRLASAKRRGEQQRHLDDHRLDRVRQHVLPEDMRGRGAEASRRVDVEFVTHDQGPGPRQTGQLRRKTMPTAIMPLVRPMPSAPVTAIASTMAGNDSSVSIVREMTSSTQPPK